MNCPESERVAAYAEGRLDAAEAALFLEHCAECDDCRREIALLTLAREKADLPEPVPPGVRARTVQSVLRSLERERERTPRFAHPRVFVRERRSPGVVLAAAAALLIAVAGLVALVRMREGRPGASGSPVQIAAPSPRAPLAPSPEIPRVPDLVPLPSPPPDVARRPEPVLPAPAAPEPRRVEEPRPDPVTPEPEPRPEEVRPRETAPSRPAHAIATRSLGELQVTDVTGAITVRRKGSREKERLVGVARLAEGDLLTAEKPAAFQVQGVHPVVLAENTTVSLAFAPQEQAPYLHVRSGEATVDSTGPTPWVISDGRVAVVVKQARGRFVAASGADRLLVSALNEPLFLQPDGGEAGTLLRPGEELSVGRAAADVRRLDLNLLARKGAAFDASRPRQRTIFFTSCDATDAKGGHFFLQEGAFFKNEAVLSQLRPDKTAHAVISPNPRFAWREGLLLRFRFRTNATQVQAALRADERRYTLFKVLPVERKNANQWIPAELLVAPTSLSFRRDDGVQTLTVTSQDKFDWVGFQVHQKDVFGDQKVYLLVDDIQVVEKEKD